MKIQYCEVKPDPSLTADVTCLWRVEATQDRPSELALPVLPDGCMELIVQVSGTLRKATGSRALPRSFVTGQFTRPLRLEFQETVLLGARFRPTGTLSFFDTPPATTVNRILPLEQAWKTAQASLERQLKPSQSPREQFAVLDQFLASHQREHPSSSGTVRRAVRQIVQERGQGSIERLAARLDTAERELRRRFHRDVGISPKMFSRIIRFRSALGLIRRGREGSWADVALRCGFFDQPHLNRDFRTFAHQSPRQLLHAHTRLQRSFLSLD